jgi:alpha-beta hydrolase superfamily lysophospholipase
MKHPPVVFVHGMWIHATSWAPWIERFGAGGYQATAADWPGDPSTVEGARADPRSIADRGIEEIVEHHKRYIGGLDERPILVGHCIGGLIIQRLLAEDFAVAGVAIDPAPIKGVLRLPVSSLKVAAPVLRKRANRDLATTLTKDEFRYAFGNAIPAEESDELYARWAIPGPGRPLFESAFAAVTLHSPAWVDTKNCSRGPLLFMAGGRDHTVPATVVRAARRRYSRSAAVTDILEFPDRGHSITLDQGWPEIADAALDWLRVKAPDRQV